MFWFGCDHSDIGIMGEGFSWQRLQLLQAHRSQAKCPSR